MNWQQHQPRKREGQSRWNSCEKKDRFNDENDAERRAKRLGLRAYPCRHCNGYHLTSKERR